jgi:hypothetical protein
MSIENIVQNLAALAPGGTPPSDGAPPAPSSVTPPPPPPPAATPPPVAPQSVTIPLDQLNAFTAMQARLARVEEEQQRREAAAREEQIKILAAKGQVEEALRTQREEAQRSLDSERALRAQTEERAKRYALDGELARVLGSQSLVTGGAEQLTALLRDQFVVEPQGNSFAVRTQDFRSVGDFIGAQLGRPEFAHFLRAQNPNGGTGSAGTQSVQTGTPAPPAEAPATFSDAVIMQSRAAQAVKTDPRLDRTVSFGLRPLSAKTG